MQNSRIIQLQDRKITKSHAVMHGRSYCGLHSVSRPCVHELFPVQGQQLICEVHMRRQEGCVIVVNFI